MSLKVEKIMLYKNQKKLPYFFEETTKPGSLENFELYKKHYNEL